MADNELSYLETVHLFVELLDSFFSNVCELDIVFNFNKVYSILDEFMLAGEIQESSKREILDRVKFLEKMEWTHWWEFLRALFEWEPVGGTSRTYSVYCRRAPLPEVD